MRDGAAFGGHDGGCAADICPRLEAPLMDAAGAIVGARRALYGKA
jgi:hypothetical protein